MPQIKLAQIWISCYEQLYFVRIYKFCLDYIKTSGYANQNKIRTTSFLCEVLTVVSMKMDVFWGCNAV